MLSKISPDKCKTVIEIERVAPSSGPHVLVYKSQVIRDILDVVDSVAEQDSPVLIYGESGVGKGLFAEQIHRRGPHVNAPFLQINCADLPKDFFEAGLFSAKGMGNVGKGTVFLDNIDDMPLPLQATLLTALRKKVFEKASSDVQIAVNARIIAASNKNLEVMVGEGEFDQELYSYLNTVLLEIPPLRKRVEDIPELGGYFLGVFSQANRKQFNGFMENAVYAMLAYSWPGNVKELKICIERACIISREKLITKEDLFPQSDDAVEDGDRSLKNALNICKVAVIRKVLGETGWNRTEAAKALKIQRTYLSRLIKEFNIRKNEE